ncbi:MAG: GAF domain-containing protein [Nitrospirota bacterium]
MLYNTILMGSPDLLQKKYSILQEISNAIVVTDDISAIANLMLDLAINYTNSEKGSLMLINERDELYILAARGIDIELIKTYTVKMGEGIAGTVAKNRLPVLVEDIGKDEKFKVKKWDRYETKSFISCPIISKNKLLGVLNINDKKDRSPFTEDELSLIKIIANQAAIALENAFLMNKLRAKAAELEEINKKLIETDVVKTEFLTRVSHELRTPLNSIKGAIFYLNQTEKLTRNKYKEFYSIISMETDKLISIIENQLDFLRLEDETRVIKKSVINLVDLLKEILNSKLLRNIVEKKNLQLKIDAEKDISDIVGDKIWIVQLFINMIEGLSHYLESGDTLEIIVSENDFVKVKLNLPRRMPEAIIPSLFDLKHVFIFKTDQSEEKLKLYLARKVIDAHRWNLNAENADGTFLVSIIIPKSTKQTIEAIIDTTAEMFIEFISELLDLNICSMMISDELTGELSIASARGLDENVIKRTRIKFGDSIAGWVALEGKPLLIEDIERDPHFGRKSIPQYNTKSLLSIPLKIQNKVIGVLNLNNKKTAEPFTIRDLYIASAISERVSNFIEKIFRGEYKENDFKQFITAFENLISAEKKYHKKKSLLPDLMGKIMDKLGANEEEKKLALYVSTIYDLGLMLVDENVLNKEKLLPAEAHALQIHPYTTINLLNYFEFSEAVRKAILHHHERYDGSGYPDRLKGEEIPFLSRVLCVVDSFCAMITERPYRKAFTMAEALEEIRKDSNSIYDPAVVKALEKVLDEAMG